MLSNAGYDDVRYSATSWSGKGVYRNFEGGHGPVVPQMFPFAVANDYPTGNLWNFAAFVPDVFVSLLGCNDFSMNPEPSFANFSNAYNNFLDVIESVYPSLRHIVVLCGPFDLCCYGNYQQRLLSARNDPRVTFLSINGTINPAYPGPDTGCAAHPNLQGANKMANPVFKYLMSIIY